jgi:membrane associated rhomboid family serine protease
MADSNSSPVEREPFFNAPLVTLVIPLVILAGYGLQALAGPSSQEALADAFALNPLLLRQGHWDLLLSHIFLHGSWAHAGLNAAFCLAFSAPMARAAGRGAGGVLSFLVFFLLCGAVAGLGYCVLNWHENVVIVGASGAISGLMGASSRLMGMPRGQLNRFASGPVVGMTVFWCGVNAASAFIPDLMGLGTGGAPVAWQDHVVGYLFGLFLIEPWLRLFHRQYFTTN